MGGFKNTTKAAGTGTPSLATVRAGTYGLSKEFAADDVVTMPTPDASLAAAARMRRELLSRSGRESTRLVGRNTYANIFLGDTG